MFLKILTGAVIDLYCNKVCNGKLPTVRDFLEAYESSKLVSKFIADLKKQRV